MFRRFYHTSVVNFSYKKAGIQLNKLLNPSQKKKWYPNLMDQPVMPSVKSLTKTTNQPGKQGHRRITMLNKMFMKHITDLMSHGSTAIDVVGRGLEISKVTVTPDLQRLNVFWVCKGDTSDEETESILNRIAGALRHELSTLRVMGQVPYIMFVKDKQEARVVDIDRRLAVADYGEDFTPTDLGHILKSEFVLNTKLSPEMKAKIKQLEETSPMTEEPIPEMTHNVFGLDHMKMMSRLLAARKRSKDAWSNIDAEPVISYRTSNTTSQVNVQDQRKELAEFLHKRQIQQNQIHKVLRDKRALEMYPDDVVGRYDPDLDEDGNYEDSDEEYDEEDDIYLSGKREHFHRIEEEMQHKKEDIMDLTGKKPDDNFRL